MNLISYHTYHIYESLYMICISYYMRFRGSEKGSFPEENILNKVLIKNQVIFIWKKYILKNLI